MSPPSSFSATRSARRPDGSGNSAKRRKIPMIATAGRCRARSRARSRTGDHPPAGLRPRAKHKDLWRETSRFRRAANLFQRRRNSGLTPTRSDGTKVPAGVRFLEGNMTRRNWRAQALDFRSSHHFAAGSYANFGNIWSTSNFMIPVRFMNLGLLPTRRETGRNFKFTALALAAALMSTAAPMTTAAHARPRSRWRFVSTPPARWAR